MRIVIPLFAGFTALDAVGPYEVLRFLPQARVVFAAAEPGPIRDHASSLALVAGSALDDVTSADVLVVPGGPAAREHLTDEAFLGWIRRIHETSAWTASVCTGSLLLGASGLLDGLEATTHWSAAETLESFGATYSPRRVVVEGRIVTAAGVSAGIDMALTLAARIAGQTRAEAIQLAIEYDPMPPFDAGSPGKAPRAAMDLLAAGLR